jgi:nucleoside-diphosphate-sugar epimerase
MARILVTGGAGFIGSHVLEDGLEMTVAYFREKEQAV